VGSGHGGGKRAHNGGLKKSTEGEERKKMGEKWRRRKCSMVWSEIPFYRGSDGGDE
jgi:hypothetical protein